MFLRIGAVVAWIAMIFGTLQAGRAMALPFIFSDPDDLALFKRTYIGSQSLTESFQQGIALFFIGVVLGVLVAIGQELRRRNAQG